MYKYNFLELVLSDIFLKDLHDIQSHLMGVLADFS
jgi:hypothetical protein